MESEQTRFSCLIAEVFSGDDLIVMVDLGVEDLWKRMRVRLHGVDTPNAVSVKNHKSDAARVRQMVRNLVYQKRGLLTIISRNRSSWVVNLEVESGPGDGRIGNHSGHFNLNELLISQGYSYKKQPTNSETVNEQTPSADESTERAAPRGSASIRLSDRPR